MTIIARFSAAACGNVFTAGEPVVLPLPDIPGIVEGSWQVLNDQLQPEGAGVWSSDVTNLSLGILPVGWHRIEFMDENRDVRAFTTAAVLMPQPVAPPSDTPIAVDVALSWVPRPEEKIWRECVLLARMAGAAMVRDRLRWRDIQPAPGPLLTDTRYEATAALQQGAGLQVLQVFHDSPSWTWRDASERGRVPADLRHTYAFCRELSAHFRGRVQAWQPWNEGNSGNFGGHAMDELCSHQKAAFLGFRAGDADAVVCWGPLGGINSEALYRGIADNGTSAYFDVYTMHSYDWNHDYPRLRQYARKAAAGKPMWVTECDRGMEAAPDSPVGDLTHDNEKRKAHFIIQSYASSLAAGAARHFHFILPQYMEQNNRIQFGLLRHDNTPRMGYVALAAAGRLLAGARYLGQLQDESNPDVYIFAFRAFPDGNAKDMLTAWTEKPWDWPERGKAAIPWTFPEGMVVESVWDYLGRPVGNAAPAQLTSTPIFIVLPENGSAVLPLAPPEAITPAPETTPSPVVLQLSCPALKIAENVVNWAHESDRIASPGEYELHIAAYNFSSDAVSGAVSIASRPAQWRCEPEAWQLSLASMDRQEQVVRVVIPAPGPSPHGDDWIQFRGDFSDAGQSCLAFRILPEKPGESQE